MLIQSLLLAAFCFLSTQSVTYEEDGSVTYHQPDGSTRTVLMDGKTPYGAAITEVRRVIRKKEFVVELVFASATSDEDMDKYVKVFFDELESGIRKKMNALPECGNRMTVTVSLCKYCKTGFCRRSNKRGITLQAVIDGTALPESSWAYADLLGKDRAIELAIRAADALFKDFTPLAPPPAH